MCISILQSVGHEFIKRYTVHKKRTPKSDRLIGVGFCRRFGKHMKMTRNCDNIILTANRAHNNVNIHWRT